MLLTTLLLSIYFALFITLVSGSVQGDYKLHRQIFMDKEERDYYSKLTREQGIPNPDHLRGAYPTILGK